VNNHLSMEGIITMGEPLVTANTGRVISIVFLKRSDGHVVILPPRWYLPWLLKGRAEVPSNCSERTAMFLKRSKTNALVPFCASCFTWLSTLSMFSGVGV
jgi:hypothetical protein